LNILSAFGRHSLPPLLPDHGRTWGAGTVKRLLELLRFVMERPGKRWMDLV
jgi:hypothetical protein